MSIFNWNYSRHGNQVIEEPLQIPASRRASSAQQQDELDRWILNLKQKIAMSHLWFSHRDQQTASGRISKTSQESTK